MSSELSEDAFRGLVRELVAADLPGLPANLWAEDRLELEVRVLGQGRAVQARRFGRLGPDTHGAAQERFDRFVEALRVLAPQAPQRPRSVPPASG